MAILKKFLDPAHLMTPLSTTLNFTITCSPLSLSPMAKHQKFIQNPLKFSSRAAATAFAKNVQCQKSSGYFFQTL